MNTAIKTIPPAVTRKIALFRQLFSGLGYLYGTFDPETGRCWQVKAPVTDKVIEKHLRGQCPYGVYLLTGDRLRALAVDFDDKDARPPVELIWKAEHFELPMYLEKSKSKGYHVWTFFHGKGVSARKARLVVHSMLQELEMPQVEVFPKQDQLTEECPHGNFIFAPLFGSLVLKGRTVFCDPVSLKPYSNQWDFLKKVQRIPETLLDQIIEINSLDAEETPERAPVKPNKQENFQGALYPCAVRMLEQGVTANQRVACFRLAIQLKRAGLPFDMALGVLREWSIKNRPANGKRIITAEEIRQQARDAYEKPYRGYGCEDPAIRPYCDPTCPIREKKMGGYKNSNR